jgi:exodeoxyribonuclease V alpha subunit
MKPPPTQLGLFEAKPQFQDTAKATAPSSEITSVAVLRERGILSDLDCALARTLLDLVGESGVELELGVALASWAVQRGHVCADLHQIAQRGFHDEAGQAMQDVTLPELPNWTALLRQSSLVQRAGSDEAVSRPLLLTDDARLYLARYFKYEQRLAQALLARSRSAPRELDRKVLEERVNALFPSQDSGSEGQRRACLRVASSALSVISGGPGTGKTYSVGKILSLLQEQARASNQRCEIALLAPTGKAAQRMTEALGQQLEGVAAQQRAGMPEEASTIHRALGYQQKSPTRFRHDRHNPLPADVVVVDETSMVDLALMTKLVDAVHPEARLILLGDKDQLASVEAGAIFGDICAGLRDATVHLTHVHRYESSGSIAKLASLVNTGDTRGALDLLGSGDEQVQLVEVASHDTPRKVLGQLACERFAKLHGADTAEQLQSLSRFRFLCAHRRGPWGVEAVNALVQSELSDAGLPAGIASGARVGGDWYEGRPILVTENDYSLDLFNGDVGIILRNESDGSLVAGFPGKLRDAPRHFPLAQLPAHETVFAMSVHKAQGSELDEVAVILPEQISPVVTRELIYTAITRARHRVTIYGSKAVLSHAIATPVLRASGLTQLLRN